MSNEYLFSKGSGSQKDNEQRSFRPDQNGDAARNIVSAQLDDVISAINDKDKVTKRDPVIYNVICPNANEEYSQVLRDNTAGFTLRSRGRQEMRISYEPGGTAAGGVIASSTSETAFNNIPSAADWKSQVFLADIGGPVSTVKIMLEVDGAVSGNVSLQVRDESGGVPGSTVLATSELVDVSTIPGTVGGDVVTFVFNTPAVLTQGTSYAIVLDVSGVTSFGNYIRTRVDTTNPYANGTAANSANNGVSWTAVPSFDLYFQIDSYPTHLTLRGNAVYSEDNLNITGTTLYFQSSDPDMIVEIVEWV